MNTKKSPKIAVVATLLASIAVPAGSAWADSFQVTVTNATRAQAFTPRLAFTHSEGRLFTLGEEALDEVATIAESGDVDPALTLLGTFPDVVTYTVVQDDLLNAGGTEVFTIEGNSGDYFTLISMLIPTNDAFLGLNATPLPASGTISHFVLAYDAGSELNDESCSNIPGPVCNGSGASPLADGEGFIYVHNGIHGIGDLASETYSWNNPIAYVTITRID